MNYTIFFLSCVGIVGMLLHNLVKIDEINKDPSKGNFNLASYWKREWASILISVIFVIACAFLQDEIKRLHDAGEWLGGMFLAIGYMAQSLLVKMMGKAQKAIEGNS
jgi:hypothetical protein